MVMFLVMAASGFSSGGRRLEGGDVGWRSWGGGRASLSLGWFDTGENNDLPRISFAFLNPFRMCRGGGSSLGRLQADWR